MSFLSNLAGGGIGDIIESVGNVADKFITTDKEKEELELSKDRLKLEFYSLEVADRESARVRETEINKTDLSSWITKNITSILALGCIILTFILFYQVLYMEIKPESKDIIIYILGALSAITTQIVGYYFGSSIGSKDKTNILSGK